MLKTSNNVQRNISSAISSVDSKKRKSDSLLIDSPETVEDKQIIKINTKKVRKSSSLTNELLLSSDGLLEIYRTFPNKHKFRGKGYERSDLQKLMADYKLWAWNLNPGSAFPDFLMKCERLGRTEECKMAMQQFREIEKENYAIRKLSLIEKKIKTVTFVELV